MSLRRTHFRDLPLNRASTDAVRSKVRSAEIAYTGDDKRLPSSRTHPHSQPQPQAQLQRHSCPPHIRHPITVSRRRRHPINSLPPELLGYIFVIGSESDHTFPIHVSHVCGGWRDIALETPALWRRVSFDGIDGRYRFTMWKERITRAKACSLDIELGPATCPSNFKEKGHPHFDIHSVQYYMYFIHPTLARWRSLHITFPNHSPFLWNASLSPLCSAPASGKASRVHAPLLEELSLIYPTNDDSKQFTLFGGSAPRLRHLSLDGVRLAWLPGLMANLRYLEYTHRGDALGVKGQQAVGLVLDMLEVSSRIEELRLFFPNTPTGRGGSHSHSLPGHARTHKRVALPFLACLHLRVDGTDIPHEMYNLLPNLALPALTSLHFIDASFSSHPFPHLGAFLNVFRIPPTVRYLHLEGGWVDHRLLPSILNYLKALSRVSIVGARLPDPHFVGFEVRRTAGRGYLLERAGPRHRTYTRR